MRTSLQLSFWFHLNKSIFNGFYDILQIIRVLFLYVTECLCIFLNIKVDVLEWRIFQIWLNWYVLNSWWTFLTLNIIFKFWFFIFSKKMINYNILSSFVTVVHSLFSFLLLDFYWFQKIWRSIVFFHHKIIRCQLLASAIDYAFIWIFQFHSLISQVFPSLCFNNFLLIIFNKLFILWYLTTFK
jgi:hypothetical protein